MPRTPTYYLSTGGPNVAENKAHPAYAKLQAIGQEITKTVKPKAMIVFSAHWQAGPRSIEVNTAETQPLIYDFYGFPPHYYEQKFPSKGSPELANRVIDMLKAAGIQAKGTSRGLDHGVFSPFIVAFNPKTNPLEVPLVQVSLFDNEDPNLHYALGRAVAPLRDEGIIIVTTGMSVHNLRDFRRAMQAPEPMPYVKTFDAALKVAAEKPAEQREEALAALLKRSDARDAHPSFEHILPVHIAAGAAESDGGKELWTMPDGSAAWGMYRFGEA